ncbi:hypothetical protein H8959_002357 [Pygathrix nigripes]
MSLQSRLSGRLVQLLVPPRPRPGHLAGATRTRSSTCCPPAFLGVFGRSARTSAGVGAWGAAAVGRTAGVRTWAPLAMAAKVDLSTSTDWKEAKWVAVKVEEPRYKKDKQLNEKISLFRGDITKLEVDAIVNAGGNRGSAPRIGAETGVISAILGITPVLGVLRDMVPPADDQLSPPPACLSLPTFLLGLAKDPSLVSSSSSDHQEGDDAVCHSRMLDDAT